MVYKQSLPATNDTQKVMPRFIAHDKRKKTLAYVQDLKIDSLLFVSDFEV